MLELDIYLLDFRKLAKNKANSLLQVDVKAFE